MFSAGRIDPKIWILILSEAKNLCILINQPASANAAAIGRFRPYDRPRIRCGYSPGRIPRHPRTQAEYDRHPKGFADSPTSIPNTPASFFARPHVPASASERLPQNRCDKLRSGRDPLQTRALADSRDLFATSTHARTNRCRMYVAVLALPARTSGTTLARSALSEARCAPHGRLAWFAACSSQSSLRAREDGVGRFADRRTLLINPYAFSDDPSAPCFRNVPARGTSPSLSAARSAISDRPAVLAS